MTVATLVARGRPALAAAGSVVAAIAQHPGRALAALIAGQMTLVLWLFSHVENNQWLTYQGGDQIWLLTSGWLLGDGTIPTAVVSYGWPVVMAPLTWIFGPSSLDLLPATTLLQVLVLGPLATLAVYDIGARVAGRIVGLWLAVAVVVAPYLATPFFVDRYRERWTDQVLVQATGLTQLADYPSTVVALVCAALVVRSLAGGRTPETLLAGGLAGFMIALKPANVLFLAGPALAYLLARRRRELLLFGLSLVPALVTLALWKARGLGELPILSADGVRLAAGATADALPVALTITKSPLQLDDWLRNMSNLREFFWSARLAQWAPLAGAFAVWRVSRPAAGLIFGWSMAYIVVKGASSVAGIENASFWRLVMPALPAYVMLAAFVPLLVPTLQARAGAWLAPAEPLRRISLRTALGIVAILGLVPLAFVAVGSPQRGPEQAVVVANILVPVDAATVTVTARAQRNGSVELTWTDASSRARTFYHVYRAPSPAEDVDCRRAGADRCTLDADDLAVTRNRRFVDRDAAPGAVYRVGVAANWVDDTAQGDVFVLSPPVTVR